MKNLKNIGRRSISLFLVFVLCISMLNLTVFAEGEGKEGKVVEGAFVAANGVLAEDFTSGKNLNTTSTPGGKVEVSKTAKPVACEDGNMFDVTLTVKTTDQEIKKVESPDAAVTLVIDLSGSMERCAECGESSSHKSNCKHHKSWNNNVNDTQTRLAAAKTSAKEFLDSLKDNTTANDDNMPKRYVTLVVFAKWVEVKADWVDIMSGTGLTDLKTAIDRLTISTGDDIGIGRATNLERGLVKAKEQMKLTTVSKVAKENKFTVVLTDGEPTRYGATAAGPGSSSSWDVCSAAIQAANGTDGLKTYCNAIYSVYFGHETGNVCYKAKNTTCTIPTFLGLFSNKVYSADNSDKLSTSFENISKTIALLTQAWEVTDPMGPNVTFVEVLSGQGTCVSVNEATNTLTWDLKTDVAHNNTYTLKYRVSVDATGADYNESAVHPLNGYTYLTYVIKNDGDGEYYDDSVPATKVDPENSAPTLAFNVPGVKVDRPLRPWRIEFYKQENAKAGEWKNYTHVEKSDIRSSNDVKVGITKIKLAEECSNYLTKYAADNYEWVHTENAILAVTADGDNVIKVYYNKMTTSATVNYHYTLTTIDKNGNESSEDYAVPGTPVTGLFVGDPYDSEAPETSTHGTVEYTFDHADPSTTITELNEDGKENVIDLYYVANIDEREDASVVVDHVYITHTWELKDGKYQPVDLDPVTVQNVQKGENLKATTTYNVSNEPTTGYEDYTAVEGNVTQITLKAGENKVTQTFEKTDDIRGDSFKVTVKHHYTKSVTTVDEDGNVLTTITTGEAYDEPVTMYRGEKFEATERPVYEGDTYEASANNKLVYNSLPCSITINLYYTLVVEPGKADVTVTYTYKTITHRTETVVDEETGEATVIDLDDEETYDTELSAKNSYVASGLYEGARYTAMDKTEGYKYESGDYSVIVAKDGSEIIINYVKEANAANKDDREDTSIGVIHKYTLKLTSVVGGEVKTITVENHSDRKEINGKIGDRVEAKIQPEFGGKTYKTDDVDTTVILKETNDDIVFEYVLVEEDLEETSYTVNYEYYTRTMTVVDGVLVEEELVQNEAKATDTFTGTGYVGQMVKLNSGAVVGYAPYGVNPGTTQFLEAGENVYTFKYVKDILPALVDVTAQHIVTYKTITLTGTTENTIDCGTMPLGQKYVGESYAAQAMQVGKLISVTVNDEAASVNEYQVVSGTVEGKTAIVFKYEIVSDLRRPVEYSIQYKYYDVDYDGTEIPTSNLDPTTGSSYAGLTLGTTPEKEDVKGYKLTEATFNGEDIMDQQSVTLVDGTNEIVYIYKRSIDSRPTTEVTVIHEYYTSASATEAAYTDKTLVSQDSEGKDLRAPSKFTATPVETRDDVVYVRTTAADALTITLAEDKDENVIVIKYVLADTSYQVVHEYYTDGTLTGSTDPIKVAGEAGKVITAAGITKVTSYNGNTYTFNAARSDESITLIQGENGAITLRYYRTTGGGGDNGGGDNGGGDDDGGDPTPPTVVITPVDVPLVETPIEEEEIISEDVPLVETPVEEPVEEEEIIEDDVPLSEVPKTSDLSSLWYTMALLSACGLAAMALLKKREK